MLITGCVVDHYSYTPVFIGAAVDLCDDSVAPCGRVAAHPCRNNSSKVIGYWAISFILITGFVVDHFHCYTPILVAPLFCPFWGRCLVCLGGLIRRITLEEAKIPN